MFDGVYGAARMPNLPHRHRILLPGIATSDLRRDALYMIVPVLYLQNEVAGRASIGVVLRAADL